MLGALAVTLTALLLERALRLLDMLSASRETFRFVAGLVADLVPHYLGLALPAGFFIAMFIVFTRMSDASEIDVLLASGVSFDRIARPYLALGLGLGLLSFALSGFIQPESRYAYRVLLNAAQTQGWNGRVERRTIVATDERTTVTADDADLSGRELRRVFIRQISKEGRERLTTAERAVVQPNGEPPVAVVNLFRGQQVRFDRRGEPQVALFDRLVLQIPLAAPRPLRARGLDERELTALELAARARAPRPGPSGRTLSAPAAPGSSPSLPALRAELYGRIAHALALPLLPLLALPLSLAAKRGARGAGAVVAALLLAAFQHVLQLGQTLGGSGRTAPELGVGLPLAVFAGLCGWMFLTSRTRPGDTPVGRAIGWVGAGLHGLRAAIAVPRARSGA